MSSRILTTLSINTLLILISLTSNSLAKFEQQMLPISQSGKKVTFTFYHFNNSKSVILSKISKDLGLTSKQQNSKAAISASANTTFSFSSGKFTFPKNAQYLLKNGTPGNILSSRSSTKHTLILTNNKKNHAICYAPSMNTAELSYALKRYMTNNKIRYTSAIITNAGNQSSFYKTNGEYRPYYLKELKKTAKGILIK